MPVSTKHIIPVLNESDKMFVRLLRDARIAGGLTQHQLSVRLGISQSMVAKIEKGERPAYFRYMPKFLYWLKCCEVGLSIKVVPMIRDGGNEGFEWIRQDYDGKKQANYIKRDKVRARMFNLDGTEKRKKRVDSGVKDKKK